MPKPCPGDFNASLCDVIFIGLFFQDARQNPFDKSNLVKTRCFVQVL